MRNPWFIAVLNFVTIGLGTLLLGRRPLHGLLVFLGASLLRYEEVRIGPALTGELTIHWVVATTGLTLLGLAAAREGFREARSLP